MGSDTAGPAAEVDPVDRALLHALQLDPRLPFSRIAEVLDVSDQTIARRYRRLRSTGVVHLVALANPWRIGQGPWFVRLRCIPDAAAGMAESLARRPDTGWVYLLSGGAEIDCTVLPLEGTEDGVLLQRLTRTGRVVSVTAHSMLQIFAGSQYAVLDPVLAEQQVTALCAGRVESLRGREFSGEPTRLDPADRALIEMLGRDARAPLAELARVTGWSESHVRRRLEWLLSSGTLFFEVDIDPAQIGLRMKARLWITAEPDALASVGEAMSHHPEAPFVAATTGPTNIVASVFCRDPGAFYAYLTAKLGTLPGIRHIETAPIVRTLKRAGHQTTSG